jgi:hypothetical protein
MAEIGFSDLTIFYYYVQSGGPLQTASQFTMVLNLENKVQK